MDVPALGNGYITTKVLREILAELDDKLTGDELDEMIDEIDEDGSGTIDFDGKSGSRGIHIYQGCFNHVTWVLMTSLRVKSINPFGRFSTLVKIFGRARMKRTSIGRG